MHRYQAYGLTISSEISLPELIPLAPNGQEVDVRISLGGVPERLTGSILARRVTWTAGPGQWLHEVKEVGRYYVKGGREIRIEPLGSDQDVRAFLFSSPLGVLLHQRGLLALHASSVLIGGRAVAITGRSTAGKSSTLAAFVKRGYSMITDDKTALYEKDGQIMVPPGYPTVRLWHDAMEKLGIEIQDLPRLRSDLEKYLYRASVIHSRPAPFGALFFIKSCVAEAKLTMERLDETSAFQLILRQTYQKHAITGLALKDKQFELAASLAAKVPVFRLRRPAGRDTIGEVADVIERQVEECSTA